MEPESDPFAKGQHLKRTSIFIFHVSFRKSMEKKTAKNKAIFQKLPAKRPEFQVSEFSENLPGILDTPKSWDQIFHSLRSPDQVGGPCWGGGFTKMLVNNTSSRENIDINIKKSNVAHEVTIVICSHVGNSFASQKKSVEKKHAGLEVLFFKVKRSFPCQFL